MDRLRIDHFAEMCGSLSSEMEFLYSDVSPVFTFSNSGRRGGKKYFSISLLELLNTFIDIEKNIELFFSNTSYDEQAMRDLFHSIISTPTINALSTVQTLPLYNTLSKVICVANGLEYEDKNLPITQNNLANTISYLKSQLPDNDEYLSGLDEKSSDSRKVDKKNTYDSQVSAENIIFYGAPGVGKSHQLEEKCDASSTVRTVFHPDSQYADFAGCLKPRMDGDKVIYDFRLGPFCQALINAYQETDKHHYLVIEEINRAPAAAVFGEIFQLLDRSSDGSSRYPVTLSDPDMIETIRSNAPNALEGNQIRLPANLSLLATMNSSDQAVMPLDTAFKRRWKFQYIPIDFTNCPAGNLTIPLSNSNVGVDWKTFAITINKQLEQNRIPEDRLLGPWFLSPAELSSKENAAHALKGKVLMYLWDDVLRHGEKTILFADGIHNFGQLLKLIDAGESIFNDVIESELHSQAPEITSTPYLQVAENESPDYS